MSRENHQTSPISKEDQDVDEPPENHAFASSATNNSPQTDAVGSIKRLAKEASTKTKRILRIDDTKNQLQDGKASNFHKIEKSLAFNPEITLNAESSTLGQIKDQLPNSLEDLAHIIRHPRQHVKEKTSKTVTASQEPYLTRDDDESLVDNLEKLEQSEAALEREEGSKVEVNALKDKIEQIEVNRKEKRVAWTSSRYIHRARVINQVGSTFPLLSSSRWIDSGNDPQGHEWSQWIDNLRSMAKFDLEEPSSPDGEPETVLRRDLMLQEFERIAMASNPFQKWLSSIQQLWMWNNPIRTTIWLSIWLSVWYLDRVFTFINCCLLYHMIRPGNGSETRALLKKSHDRAGDQDAQADTLGEMVSRHGSSNWLDSILESLAPFLPQIRNLANWMEMAVNFYEWKTPRAMAAFIFLFGSVIAISTSVSTDVSVRILTLMSILAFFTHVPISVRCPKYLRLLLPYHWVFWDVPTHIETSFRYLRLQAEDIRNASIEEKSTTTDSTLKLTTQTETSMLSDIFAAQCTWQSISGVVILSFENVRFMRNFPVKEMWKHPFHEMEEIKKGDGQTAAFKSTENFLEFTFKNCTVRRLEKLKKKDELFNVIVAFSGLSWYHT